MIPDGWCAWHNEVEPLADGHITCPECWHSFPDADAVLAAHNAWQPDAPPDTDIEQVFSCPLCIHDW